MTNAHTIAAGLTAAQRNALLWCHVDGSPRDHIAGSPREVSFYVLAKVIKGDPCSQIATIYSLVKRGENKVVGRGRWLVATWMLTPLGLAVRAILQEQDHGE